MAGSPQRRAQREGLRRLTYAELMLGGEFSSLTPAQQFERLFSGSLVQAAQVMSWDLETVSTAQLAAWNMIRHDLWQIKYRIGLDRARSAERERALASLVDRLPVRYRNGDGQEHKPN